MSLFSREKTSGRLSLLVLMVVLANATMTQRAYAFMIGPHSTLTRDALAFGEGASHTAALAQGGQCLQRHVRSRVAD